MSAFVAYEHLYRIRADEGDDLPVVDRCQVPTHLSSMQTSIAAIPVLQLTHSPLHCVEMSPHA